MSDFNFNPKKSDFGNILSIYLNISLRLPLNTISIKYNDRSNGNVSNFSRKAKIDAGINVPSSSHKIKKKDYRIML
ncbi:MAG: hypothetical protein ACFFDH_23020 [Promethearchaeota archaeon]